MSLGDLFGGHLGGDDVAVFHPPVAILARRLSDGDVEPHVRFDVVLRDALAAAAQEELFEQLELVSGRDVLVAKFARVCSRKGRRAPA